MTMSSPGLRDLDPRPIDVRGESGEPLTGDQGVTRIVLQSKTGPDGVLHLDVPLGEPDTSYEVELVLHPRSAGRPLPPGYFKLIGSVDDETFVAHSQPPVPPPVELE
jgi:hypothetical protein